MYVPSGGTRFEDLKVGKVGELGCLETSSLAHPWPEVTVQPSSFLTLLYYHYLAPLFSRPSCRRKHIRRDDLVPLCLRESWIHARPAIRYYSGQPSPRVSSECAFAEPWPGGPLAVLLSKTSTRMGCLSASASEWCGEGEGGGSINGNQSINSTPGRMGRTSAHARPASCSFSNLDCACCCC